MMDEVYELYQVVRKLELKQFRLAAIGRYDTTYEGGPVVLVYISDCYITCQFIGINNNHQIVVLSQESGLTYSINPEKVEMGHLHYITGFLNACK